MLHDLWIADILVPHVFPCFRRVYVINYKLKKDNVVALVKASKKFTPKVGKIIERDGKPR